MPDTIEKIDDLEWVEFSDEPTEPCDCSDDDDQCPREPLFRLILQRECTCGPDSILMCLHHKDRLIAVLGMVGPDLACVACHTPITILRIDPIR